MLRTFIALCLSTTLLALGLNPCAAEIPVLETGSQTPMPDEWIDSDTGHKVIRLTRIEGDNKSFYFHNGPFLPAAGGENDKMVFHGLADGRRQLFMVDLKTLETEQITDQSRLTGEIVGKRRRHVFYQSGNTVYATGVDDRQTRQVCTFPEDLSARITTINADETLLGGVISSPEERELFRKHPEKRSYFDLIYEAKLNRTLFTIDIDSGEFRRIYSEDAWLNHVQFSPSDPKLLMYCHEGPWHKVDRIWTIDVDERKPRLMHKRTMEMEIAGHEFFSRDGRRIWFDLQMPRSKTFFLSSVDVESGRQLRYSLTRDEWSIHFNISPDQKLFAGDGGDPGQVARAKDGMWIYLFHPDGDRLRSEKLVNMKHHNYRLEPNVHFSPDGKWVIFRANFEGHSDVYAVELEPADGSDEKM